MMGQEPGGERRGPRLPLLAPFITYELLLRVNNILSPLDNAQRGGWGLQASLGRAVAALTGAPRSACMEEARHQGNAMQAAVVKYVKRLRETHTWNARRSKVGQAGLKKDQETVYVCKFGGTPARPSDAPRVIAEHPSGGARHGGNATMPTCANGQLPPSPTTQNTEVGAGFGRSTFFAPPPAPPPRASPSVWPAFTCLYRSGWARRVRPGGLDGPPMGRSKISKIFWGGTCSYVLACVLDPSQRVI